MLYYCYIKCDREYLEFFQASCARKFKNHRKNEDVYSMYQLHFHNPVPIHFIGIGGISMSGLAEILLKEGFPVSGSDSHTSELTDHLAKLGAQIGIGQKASNIPSNCEVVVYTAAIHPDNPEFTAAKERGIPMLSRAELLGQLMRNYKEAIAVSGTHGKTTTTSMISTILLAAEATFLNQLDELSSTDHIDTAGYGADLGLHRLLLEFGDASFFVGLHYAEAGYIGAHRHVLTYYSNVGLFLDVVFQHFIVIHLVDCVSGRDDYIWFMTFLQPVQILIDGICSSAIPGAVLCSNRRCEDIQASLLSSEVPPFG